MPENPTVIERLTELENQVLELTQTIHRINDKQHQINASINRTIEHLLVITESEDGGD